MPRLAGGYPLPGITNPGQVTAPKSRESAPEVVASHGRVAAVETKTLGKPGPQGHAPAVHTVHYTNGLSQTLAQSESGDLFWMGMRQKPAE